MIVEGHIREKESGSLIQGAKVTLTVGPGRPGIAPPGNDLEIAILRTGSRGVFRYQEDRPRATGQTLTIHVDHPDYEPQRVFEALADQVHVDIELDRHTPGALKDPEPEPATAPPPPSPPGGPFVVSGHVRAQATGKPIDDAIVALAVGSHEIATVETHSDGSFRHEESPPTRMAVGKTLTIRVEHPAYLPWRRSRKIESHRFDIDIDLGANGGGDTSWWRELIKRIPAWAWMVFGVLKSYLWVALAALALVGIVVALFFWLFTKVPGLQGQTEQQAGRVLADAGLSVGDRTEDDVQGRMPGTVIRSEPPEGDWVLRQTVITQGSAVDLVLQRSAAAPLVADCATGTVQDALREPRAADTIYALGIECVQEGGRQRSKDAIALAMRLFAAAAGQDDGRAALSLATLYDPHNVRFDPDTYRIVEVEDRRFQAVEDPDQAPRVRHVVLACERYVQAGELDARARDLARERLRQLEPLLEDLSRQGDVRAEDCLRRSRS